jgi:alpha-galactosidase
VTFSDIDEVAVDPVRGHVYEHGWQSWSPTTSYPVTVTSYRAPDRNIETMCYRSDSPAPAEGFQGEGLLAVDPGDGGPVTVYGAAEGFSTVPSIRASYLDGRVRVAANGPVDVVRGNGTLDSALGAWAGSYAEWVGGPPLRPAPTVWCSWYHYFTQVTEADIEENLGAIGELELPVDVVQIDDGWQAEIGDWRTLSSRFGSLRDIVGRIADAGKRAGIWIAPFLVGERSELARDHPEWTFGYAGHNWQQDLSILDITHPGAAEHLSTVFRELRLYGIEYFKIDFVYAGAIEGPRASGASALDAYREGIRLIREAVGPEAYITGCGAPILPSVGLVDAMRVSPDIALKYEPDGDPSRPSQFGAALCTVGRAFQHGRFWVNDPDCLIARPAVERREDWASVVERYGGLRASSDRIADLDDWGLATTRRLLSEVPPPTPF